MKKIIKLFILLLILTSCTNKPNLELNYTLDTYRCDMSCYNGVNSFNHNFKGITVSELERCINEKGYGAFILSRTSCDHCQMIVKIINEAAKDLGVSVYYLDGESTVYPIVDTPDYAKLDKLLKEIEEPNDEGIVELQTPHFFTIVNGEFVKSYIGTGYNDDELNEKQEKSLYKKYYNALKIFKE